MPGAVGMHSSGGAGSSLGLLGVDCGIVLFVHSLRVLRKPLSRRERGWGEGKKAAGEPGGMI